MKLEALWILDCPRVEDLSPLRSQKLNVISLTPRSIKKGMEVLRDMNALQEIIYVDQSSKLAKVERAEFWKHCEK
jgi:hypothetical protein